MKTSLRRFVAAAALALSVPLAAAQTAILTFDDLAASAGPAGFFGTDAPASYQGFDFSNATGTGSSWYWAPGADPYGSIGTTNISATPSKPGVYDASVISSTTPFTLQSMVFSGLSGPIGIELVDIHGNSHYLGANFNSPSDLGTGDASTSFGGTFALTDGWTEPGNTGAWYFFVNNEQPTTLLTEIAIWGEGNTFAVDHIAVTPVPEPGTYALMALGLVGVGLVARRRRHSDAAAAPAAA